MLAPLWLQLSRMHKHVFGSGEEAWIVYKEFLFSPFFHPYEQLWECVYVTYTEEKTEAWERMRESIFRNGYFERKKEWRENFSLLFLLLLCLLSELDDDHHHHHSHRSRRRHSYIFCVYPFDALLQEKKATNNLMRMMLSKRRKCVCTHA